MLHGPAKILSGCLAAAPVNCNIVRAPIGFDDLRVFYGEVAGALFELSRRITACSQRLDYQAIGAVQGLLRMVDEKFLNSPPFRRGTARLLRAKPPDMQLLDAFLPLFQDGLCARLISVFLAHYAVVLGTESGAKLPRPVRSVIHRKSDYDNNNGPPRWPPLTLTSANFRCL